jgi:hypothetical protein
VESSSRASRERAASGPLADAVEWLADRSSILEQDQESRGTGSIRQRRSWWGSVVAEESSASRKAFDDAIEDREQSDAIRVELVAVSLGVMADVCLASFFWVHCAVAPDVDAGLVLSFGGGKPPCFQRLSPRDYRRHHWVRFKKTSRGEGHV